jgi:hypothetical protein
MFHPLFTLAAFAFFALTACEPGQTGEPCSFDSDCQSDSCSSGTCDDGGWLALFGLAADLIGEASRDSAPPPQSSVVPSSMCSGLGATACSRSSGCSLFEQCLPPVECLSADCTACLHTAGCGAPCAKESYCY